MGCGQFLVFLHKKGKLEYEVSTIEPDYRKRLKTVKGTGEKKADSYAAK